MGNDFGGYGIAAIIGAIIAGFFGWLAQRSKGEADQSVAVLGEWSKLNEALSDRLAAVEKELSEYRIQVAKQFEELERKHTKEIDEIRAKHRAEVKSLRELNEGLQRMIAQNSQSTAQLISESPTKDNENGK